MYKLKKRLKSGVRVGELHTPHGIIKTPFFMPVGTVGSVKGVSSEELEELGAEIVLSNTYHLYLRPGEKLIKKMGGLHRFMNWQKPILTDSGGYQVFSLAKNGSKSVIPTDAVMRMEGSLDSKNLIARDDNSGGLVRITDEGVEFSSHLDGSKHFFTPEKVIQIQLDLGVDILMPLDVCPNGKASYQEVKKACDLTVEWAERSKRYFESRISKLDYRMNKESRIKNQNILDSKIENPNSAKVVKPLLHGIVQGGLFPDLRVDCAEKLIALDFDGYSVGGLAVDLETRDMWDIVKLMGEILPKDKQRYLMGVGTPNDIIKATKLGMDMIDCVLPTRMGRHGSVYHRINSKPQILNPKEVKNSNFENSNIISDLDIRDSDFRYELLNLQNAKYLSDGEVIDKNCGCPACRAPINSKNREISPKSGAVQTKADSGGYSRAYISHLLKSKEILGVRLTTLHNLHTYLNLMRNIQK